MSYANGTPNFNLPQTQGSDKRDWSDTNVAFLAVDTALKTAGDNAIAASTAASTAQTTANNAATAASGAQSTANSAVSSAAAAAELATTAKNRADSAYTAAGNAQTTANAALPKTDVVNNVTTTASGKALDARQGKVLKDIIDANTTRSTYIDGTTGADGVIELIPSDGTRWILSCTEINYGAAVIPFYNTGLGKWFGYVCYGTSGLPAIANQAVGISVCYTGNPLT